MGFARAGFLDSCRAIPRSPASKADTQDFYSAIFFCASLRLGNNGLLYTFGQLRTFVVARTSSPRTSISRISPNASWGWSELELSNLQRFRLVMSSYRRIF
jgi:hypothetical protein